MPVYCITGTNRGLGLEFVRQLAQSPDNTIIAATRSLSSDLTDLKAVASPSTHILECDTGDIPSIHAFVKSVARTLGEGKKIDYLLNVAGVNLGSSQSSLNLGPDELHAQISINVLGPAKTVELLLDGGLLAPGVRVLNMTSGLASIQLSSQTARKCTGYAISKAALNMLTVHQSEDLRAQLPGAVIIAMDPGWVKTRMGGAGAQLEPSTSIGGMLAVLHGLRPEDTASFYCYSGDKVPW